MGVGIVIRDHVRQTLAMKCMSKPHIMDPTTAKAFAAWVLMELCCRLELGKVIFEGDSLEVVQILKKEEPCLSRYGYMLNDAKAMIGRRQDWTVRHVRMNANEAAYTLAKLALARRDDKLW
jgi:hypothetical protein